MIIELFAIYLHEFENITKVILNKRILLTCLQSRRSQHITATSAHCILQMDLTYIVQIP